MSDLEKRITAKMILDDSGYSNTLKGINSELKNNQSELKVARSGLEAFGRTTENMSRVQTSLQKQLELQNKKLDTYKNSIQKATDTLDKNINKRDELTRSLSKAEKAHQEAIEKYGKESKEAKETGEALDKLKQDYDKLSNTIQNNAKSIKNYETQMNKAEGEVNKAQTAVNKFNRELENTSVLKSTSQHLGDFGDKAISVGNSLTFGVTFPLIAAGAASFNFASDLNENINKTDVVFKDNAKTVEAWSKNSLEKMGMCQSSALDMASKFGDMGVSMDLSSKQAMGYSIGLTQLAADMASFKNISIERANDALTGVYTGETEALKGLGIVMTQTNLQRFAESQGIKKKIEKMTQAEQVQLRYNYIMEKTKTAQGDFARTNDQAANATRTFWESTKELGATIGNDLLPTLTPVINKANEIIKSFAGMDEETRQFILKMGMVAVAAGPVTSAVGGVSKGIGGLAKATSKIRTLKTAKNFSEFTKILLGTATATGEVASGLTGTGAAAETAGSGIEQAVNTASDFKEKATGALDSVKGGIQKFKALKGAKTFGDFTKVLLGTAEATGEVATGLAGASAVAETAGAGLTGAGVAAGGLGTTLAGMALPIAGTVAAVAGIGYAGYKTAEYLNESATPSVDLFADKVEYSTNKIQASHGALAAQVESDTVKISESTKKNIQSYLDMDKKASDSLMNIKINSNKFSKESKDAVIKNFTEMSKRSSNLSKEQQEKMTANFKKLVGDTGVLTKKNKDEIIKQYTSMVNGTKGLTKKQKDQTIKDFKDTLNKSIGLTKKQSKDLQKLYKDMGNKIKNSLDKNKKTELKSQKDFFAKSNILTTKEEADILKKTEKHWNSKKGKIDGYQKQINGIIQRAANEHRQITDKEAKTIDDIQKKMKESAVKTLSDNEVEAKVILERMKEHDENITAEMASSHIKQLNRSRDKSVSTANDECDKRLAEIMRMRDESKVISADQADKLIADAKKQRDETIDAAEETRDEAVKKIENMNKNITRDVDTATGDVKSHWDKLKDWWNSWWPKPKTTTVTTRYVTKGQRPYGNWTGNSHFQGGLTYLHERGYELYDLPSGTKIYNHESSEQMVLETARQTAQGVINSMLKNNDGQSGGDIIIPISIAGEEIDRVVVPRVSNNLALNTMRKRR